ncbi:MAG: hypothetical protein C5B60_07875 [Chloroflexi bacterium]|nr:MAG: hypothetical protein C5B60_07875 [Chloroflexota bacterium]
MARLSHTCAVVLAGLMLSGCAALPALLGGFTGGGFGSAALSSAGSVIGGDVAQTELKWFKQWRVCRRQFKTHDQRVACMERYRASLYGQRYTR